MLGVVGVPCVDRVLIETADARGQARLHDADRVPDLPVDMCSGEDERAGIQSAKPTGATMRHLTVVLRLLLGLLLLSGVAATPAVAAPGGTGHTVTITTTTKSTNPINDVNPCAPADPIVGVSQDNIVEHITSFPGGDEFWATFTDTAKVTVTDQVTGVVYSGHATFWSNFNLNERNSNSTFTETIAVKGSDGSTIHFHETAHFTLNANGDITVSFDTITVTCG